MEMKQTRRPIRTPHVFAVLMVIIVLCGILTYIVPAGQFDRIEVDGRTVVDAESFHYIDRTPVNPLQWFFAIPKGFTEGATIIALLFFCVSGFGIFTSTGALQKFMARLTKRTGKTSTVAMMCAIMAFFFVRGGLTGAVDSPIAFVPLVIPFAIAAGFDVMTGLAMIAACAFAGFSLGPTNPYSTLVAQEIAQLPPYSGMAYRTGCWLVFMVITFAYVIYRAYRVKSNPSLSLSQEVDITEFTSGAAAVEPLTTRDKWVLTVMLCTILSVIIGSLVFHLKLIEMAALYIIFGIIGGLAAGYSVSKIADVFVQSGKGMYFGVLCVAMARAIPVILTAGNITDTLIYATARLADGLPPALSAVVMFLVQTIINFFINSGSGQAAATMPIMAPLADLIGVTRQNAVLAFQLGDGISNMLWPTSGNLLAMIACAKVDYGKWVKYILPLFAILTAAACAMVAIAAVIGY